MTTVLKSLRWLSGWFYHLLQVDKEYLVRKANEQTVKQNNSHFIMIKFSFRNQA